MLWNARSVRPSERRPTWIAFAFVTALIASHTVLETARDALFLSRLPVGHLPFAYLAIAAVALGLSRVEHRVTGLLPERAGLVLWTAAAALGTLVCYALLPGGGGPFAVFGEDVALYALYVWSGVVATWILLQFWSRLSGALSVTQAKRLYPLIGGGSAAGALLGSALATALAREVSAEALLLVAAFGFGASALVACGLSLEAFDANRARPEPIAAGEGRLIGDARRLVRQPYLRRVGVLVIVSAACLTVVDFTFKSTVVASVPAAELGVFFGGVAFALNALSLASQLVLAPWLLRRFDLGIALVVLPGLLVLGGVGLGAGFGLLAGLFVKGTDGALRYSVHRTASELLYVPLPDRLRPGVKTLLDGVGQRAGQAGAALLILLLAALPAKLLVSSLALIALALVWAGSALGLRRPYLELLRGELRAGGSMRSAAFPELDVASLETLMAALDSRNDQEVLAALDVLEREGKARLVPALILHHPSEAVITRALSLFAHAQRANVADVIDRLFDHPSPRVRSAAIAARSMLAPDPRLLYLRLSLEPSPEVRATIVVHLIALSELVGAEAEHRLDEILDHGHTSTRLALAEAIASRRDHRFDRVLIAVAGASEPEVRLSAIAAMAAQPSPAYLPSLVRAAGDERLRSAARRALLAHGDAGFDAAREALCDRVHPPAVRWALPRVLASFEPQPAADVLLAQLRQERDGITRYRILRALEGLCAKNPRLALDRAALGAVIGETVAGAYRQLDARLSLDAGARANAERRTPGHELLVHVLSAKEHNARDRMWRLLGLAYPSADFARIRRNLRSTSSKTRARCVELIASSLAPPLRDAVLALIDDLSDHERLRASHPYHTPARLGYESVLEQMLASGSAALQDFTAHHVGELGLTRMRPLVAALAQADPGRVDIARALARLDRAGAGDREAVPC